MPGNIQLIFFRKKTSNDILVKFMLNEREVLINAENEMIYFPCLNLEGVQLKCALKHLLK